MTCNEEHNEANRTVDAVLFTAAAVPASVQAHQDDLGEIVVSHAYAEPATKGGTSRVRVGIENTSGQTIQFPGMEIEVTQSSEIRIDIGDGQSAPLSSLGIRPGEIVEFERTAWVQLYSLKRPLVSGSIFDGHLMITRRPCTQFKFQSGVLPLIDSFGTEEAGRRLGGPVFLGSFLPFQSFAPSDNVFPAIEPSEDDTGVVRQILPTA